MAYFGRGKNKVESPYNTSDMYEEYINWVESRELYTVKKSDFTKIIDEFNTVVAKNLLDGNDLQLPSGMGKMYIRKSYNNNFKKTRAVIDWEQTVKVGKKVFHTNEHSDGYVYRHHWDQRGASHQPGTYYYFIPCRAFKRTLAKIIKNRETDYFQM